MVSPGRGRSRRPHGDGSVYRGALAAGLLHADDSVPFAHVLQNFFQLMGNKRLAVARGMGKPESFPVWLGVRSTMQALRK